MSKLSDKLMINDIRSLAVDMINEADSGHPGIALGAATLLYTVYTYHLRYDLNKVDWCNRDRFVLSCGHASSLLYAMLHCIDEGNYNLNDLKKFRSIYSHTPGHPEYNLDKKIECTTGPLGQGFATSVGMAIAGKFKNAYFSRKKLSLFDYNVYTMVSDGDLMEGVSYEAASLAVKFNLDNLIVLYDCNNVTLDGELDEEYVESVINVYEGLGWEVLYVKNGDSVREINKAINAAKKASVPVLIVVNTVIGKYSKYEGSSKIHGSLEIDDYKEIKENLNREKWEYDKVNVALYRQFIQNRVENSYKEWYLDYEEFCKGASDKEINMLKNIINNESINLKLDKVIDIDKLFVDRDLRDINYQVMNVISAFVPNFLGGAADVVSSTKTYLKGKGDFSVNNYIGRNIAFGVREHAMASILNGLALCNFRAFGSCFLAFADYLKPAIRNACMMNLPVTYIFTHDSILVGKDGATHQPIEQLAMLRSIPNLNVYRPGDHKELIGSWNEILESASPAAIILPRGHVDVKEFTNPAGINYGGYIISEVKKSLDVILIASGSEVELAMNLKEELSKNYIEARVVSMPNLGNFLKQDADYRNEVLPKGYKKIVLEFSNDPTWYRLLEHGDEFIGVDKFGMSATPEELLKEFEFDIHSLVIRIKNSL